MADAKISALSDGGALQADDELAVNRGGTSYKARSAGQDGWISDAGETWTYASATTFTVSGDVTTKYPVGTRLKLTQTTVKYFVVVGSSFSSGTTTVTITGGTDYTFANAAVSANYHSHAPAPAGWPGWFNYTPTTGGWSGSPTISRARFNVVGRVCFIDVRVTGTSTTGATTITGPITGATSADGNPPMVGAVPAVDSGSNLANPARATIASNSSTITLTKDWGGTAFTTSGAKTVAVTGFYPI